MKSELAPVIDIYDLEDALVLQYGEEFRDDCRNAGGIRCVLFGHEFMNDCCKILSIDEETIEDIKDTLEKTIRIFLHDIFPKYDYVIIDVSW